MSKVRLSIVSLFAGFLAGGAEGIVHDPSTFGGWVVLVIGYYFFGLVVLLAAAAVLTLAGFEIRLPGGK